MSSPGSAAMTIEIPARTLADRAVPLLTGACAAVIEAVAGRHPGAPAGIGIAVGLAIAAASLWRRRYNPRPTRASLDAAGDWRLTFADGGSRPAILCRGTRVLGSSVVLRWRAGERSFFAWLTVRDVPGPRLRELRVRLLAG